MFSVIPSHHRAVMFPNQVVCGGAAAFSKPFSDDVIWKMAVAWVRSFSLQSVSERWCNKEEKIASMRCYRLSEMHSSVLTFLRHDLMFAFLRDSSWWWGPDIKTFFFPLKSVWTLHLRSILSKIINTCFSLCRPSMK